MKSEDVEINMDGELEYVEGTDELYTGKSETHYENGNLQHSGQYENGLMEGVWKYFYEDGQLYLNMTYKTRYHEWSYRNLLRRWKFIFKR